MSWSLNIGRVAGTVVRIHLTFVIFLAWIFVANYAAGGLPSAWNSVAFVLLLFFCVLLHEFGHIFTARAFGVTTPYVTLLPIGGVAQLERILGHKRLRNTAPAVPSVGTLRDLTRLFPGSCSEP